jgi:hypothetical protein
LLFGIALRELGKGYILAGRAPGKGAAMKLRMRTIVNLAIGVPCISLLVLFGFEYAIGFMVYTLLAYGLWAAWLEGKDPDEYRRWVKEVSGRDVG